MAGVVCGHCGTGNPAGRRFCENCDAYLDWDATPEPGPVARPPGPPPQQPPVQPPPPGSYRPAPPGSSVTPEHRPPVATFTPVARPPLQTAPLLRNCTNCGTTSDPTRRFCRRCGTWLVTPTHVAPAPPDPLRTRLRRRWWGGTTGAYTGDLTRGTIAFRVLVVVLVLALVAAVLTLAGWHPVRRVADLVGHVLGSGRVSGVTADAVPRDALPGHPAAWVVDDVRGRGFATRWTSGSSGDPTSACSPSAPPPATASWLVLRLPRPTDVREIGIEAGLPPDDPALAARWRPQALELHWPSGVCQPVQLAKDPGLQRFTVDQGLVSQVRVVVVAGYPPENGGSDRLDIGEITFWAR